MDITPQDIEQYSRITDAQRKVRGSSDFISEVLDRFLNGTNFSGIKLPFAEFDNLFRLREGELTVLAGINGAGTMPRMGILMGSLGPSPNNAHATPRHLMSVTGGLFERDPPLVIVKLTLKGKPCVKGCVRPFSRQGFVHDPFAVFIERLADE